MTSEIINYAIVIKRKIDTVKEIYEYLIKEVLNALKQLGLSPWLENINVIVVNNRKVSGRVATFHNGTIFKSNLKTLGLYVNIFSSLRFMMTEPHYL